MTTRRVAHFVIRNGLTTEPPFCDLSPMAWTLWLHAMDYCSTSLTDGQIPTGMLRRLSSIKDPEKAARELVDAGIWDRNGEGWTVRDYLLEQRSRSAVEADRAAATERQARHRARKKAAPPESHDTVTDLSRRDNPVSHSPPSTASTTSLSSSSSDSPPARDEPDDEPPTRPATDAVLDAMAAAKAERAGGGKGPGWYRTVKASDLAEHGERIARLLATFPGAPPATIAAYVLGEPTPSLNAYRIQEPATA